MRTKLWDEKHSSICRAELRAIPFAKRWRSRSQVEYDIKYAGYVARQEVDVARQRRLADKRIPRGFDFARIAQLRMEAREKLSRVQPASLSQATRISGITPADIALLLVHLDGKR